MRSSCQSTALADVRPGMVLAAAVCDAKGNVLLAQGMVLTETMLATLARQGVAALSILHAAPVPAPPDPVAVQARLDYLFRAHLPAEATDYATATLRRYVEDYRLQRDMTRETAR
jgi:hypothetical protein